MSDASGPARIVLCYPKLIPTLFLSLSSYVGEEKMKPAQPSCVVCPPLLISWEQMLQQENMRMFSLNKKIIMFRHRKI